MKATRSPNYDPAASDALENSARGLMRGSHQRGYEFARALAASRYGRGLNIPPDLTVFKPLVISCQDLWEFGAGERSVKWTGATVVAIGVSGLYALAETPRHAAATAPEERIKVVQTATPGMRYDDPWLRAIIIAPRLYGSMTATLCGALDFTALRVLMDKPTIAVVMSFSDEPYPGVTTTGFSGEAAVPLNTYVVRQRLSDDPHPVSRPMTPAVSSPRWQRPRLLDRTGRRHWSMHLSWPHMRNAGSR